MKKLLVVFVITMFIGASIVSMVAASNRETVDYVMVNVHGSGATIGLTLSFPNPVFTDVTTSGGRFTEVNLPGEGYTTIVGEAKLPVVRRMVEIPFGAEPEIKSVTVSWDYVSLPSLGLSSKVIPVQPSLRKDDDRTREFVINNVFYERNLFTPSNVARVVETGEIRAHRFALVEIDPVQYNPVSGELKVMRNCEVEIGLPGSDLKKTFDVEQKYDSPSFEPLLKSLLINYDSYDGKIEGTTSFDGDAPSFDGQEGYLIIVYDDFYDEIMSLANWKEDLGFDVTVTKTSEIPGGPTKENIKAYIEDAYYNWPIPPSYVLLVGDTPQIPTWTGSETGTATDLYYVTMDSDDFADIHIGRFPASQGSQVDAMVDKTVYYEEGDFPSDDFIKKAAFMASEDNHDVSEGTHNYVIDNYLNPQGYTCDKLYCHTYGATTQDVKDALNDGRSLAIYSGHGSTTSWADGPPFSQSDVNSLTNDGMYPFVCSHACLTGKFTVDECFGETWLRGSHKAALAFWGSSTYTYWDEDDILEKKMFSAWWDDNLETIGGMTDMAKYYLYQYYGGAGKSKYYLECYNVLGDPSVKIWRDTPLKADFSYTPEYPHPNDTIQFIDESHGSVVSRVWDFGDGSPGSNDVNPTHVYTQEGNYTVTLTVYTNTGKSDTESKIVGVMNNWPPIAVAHPEFYAGNNPTINFDGSDSWDPDGSIVSYYWDFKDGNTSNEVSPTYTYAQDGIYNVTLT
ncbi:MAG: PKD domain-containing protein, partial [Thermoplasmata archaeon]|nr:PKD domain-containing protein [Thermoplasmata archaeon]